MNEIKKFLHKSLTENQFDFPESIEDQFLAYLELLHQWNRAFNLTAIRDPYDMVMLHILDSLAVLPFLPAGKSIVDVGTGAGLPGIPLALTCPDKQFVLLDSNGKKTRFLTQVVLELKLKNVEIIQSRVENFHKEAGFDGIITRAFASLTDMLENTQHLLAKDGLFLAMKGEYPQQEINEIPKGFKLITAHRLSIKGLTAERHLIAMAKE